MNGEKYLLIDSSILPEVYLKVTKAKELLASGIADSVCAAVKMAGISRSAYYKYKDKVFEYSENAKGTATLRLRLEDSAGTLSAALNELYLAGANVLSINQSIPVNGTADVTVTVALAGADMDENTLYGRLVGIKGVQKA